MFNAKRFRLAVLLALLGLPVGAADLAGIAAGLAPELEMAQPIGSWTDGAGVAGTVRFLRLDLGLETPRPAVAISWNARDFDARTLRTVAGAALSDCAGLPLGHAEIASVSQPDPDGPVVLDLSVGDARLVYRIAGPVDRLDPVQGCG